MEPARRPRERDMGKADIVDANVDEDDEKLKALETDWSAELKKAKTREELKAVWLRVPAAQKTQALTAEKDLLKMQFDTTE